MASNFHGKQHSFSDRKLSEGLEHIRLAEKCMKTSLFKWKPDVDGAVDEYRKAATSFKNAKAYDEAKDMYLKTAELQQQSGATFHAAKSFEQAAMICKENKEIDQCLHLMQTAAVMFQEHGTPDTAALTLDKAAKMVEMNQPEKAIDIYLKACDVAEIEDRPRQCAEYIGKAARLMIRCRRYVDAVKTMKKEIDYYTECENFELLNKVIMGTVLVHLTQEDYVAADLFFKSCLTLTTFGCSEEAGALEDLLTAYDQGDEEMGRRTLKLPLFKYLDNAFAKLARDLVIPGGAVSPTGNSSALQSPGQESAGEAFPDGLC
ncbi:gamma-soluble NSF attachment protein-like [Haliotis rufescens]|uniref:gamma-soluble NSF attachment protein-like n=1 Tax=Haliotis rufescens TaxID=6454 RepID=UPI00201EAE38|nr:gamma-soluble NSF attachment protein-like [Haliotis rufescens]